MAKGKPAALLVFDFPHPVRIRYYHALPSTFYQKSFLETQENSSVRFRLTAQIGHAEVHIVRYKEIPEGNMITNFLTALIGGLSYLILNVASGQHFPPPLSAEEERALFERMRESGDPDARTTLIEHNLRLVAHIVRKYYASQLGQDDLVSIGTIGLIKAIDSFNMRNGARFATYASKCIQNAILT